MKSICWAVCLVLFAFSCKRNPEGVAGVDGLQDDSERLSMLQGVWLDNDTEMPVAKVRGDSIMLAGRAESAFRFVLSADTLFVQDSDRTVYGIKRLTEQNLCFYTAWGDTLRLHKAENESVWMAETDEAVLQPAEVLKKDSVLTYGGKRYRGYVYINPSTRKVSVPELAEDGLMVDNVYYDNVIHICVYLGREKLCSKDITRDMFAGVVPDNFLRNAILSDMDFVGVDADGYVYRAAVCAASSGGTFCYYVNVHIDNENSLSFQLGR